jgi:hypothetical protein
MVGPDNSTWKGGRVVTPAGYVIVWKPEHVHANARGYVHEHRMVMADHLGRALLPGEHVHHRNGDKADNRPENLELLSGSDHRRLHAALQKPGQYPRGWAKLGHGCKECGTTEQPHYSKGMCRRCHHRLLARSNRAARREQPPA